MAKNLSNPIIVKTDSKQFQLIDDIHQTLQQRSALRVIQTFKPYFENENQMIFKPGLTYVQLTNLIDRLNEKLARKGLP